MTHSETDVEKISDAALDTVKQLTEHEEDGLTCSIFSVIHGHPQTRNLVREIVMGRRHVTPDHLAYLLVVGANYVTDLKLQQVDKRDTLELKRVVDHAYTKRQELIEVCQTRNVSSNIPARYAPLNIVLNSLGQGKKVLDIGTSFGLGAYSLLSPKQFYSNVDFSDNQMQRLAVSSMNPEIVGIDTMKTSERSDSKWLQANLILGYLDQREHISNLIKLLDSSNHSTNPTFIEGDITVPQIVANLAGDHSQFDVMWGSSLLYIFSDNPATALSKVHSLATSLLTKEGLFVHADYQSWKNYSDVENSYRVVVRFIRDWDREYVIAEVPVLSNHVPRDSATIWEKGKDYEAFFLKTKFDTTTSTTNNPR